MDLEVNREVELGWCGLMMMMVELKMTFSSLSLFFHESTMAILMTINESIFNQSPSANPLIIFTAASNAKYAPME